MADAKMLLDQALHFEGLQKMGDAIALYKDVITLEPKNAFAYAHLSSCYFRLNHPQEANEFAKLAIRHEPKNTAYHLLYARTLGAIGKRSEELKHLKITSRLNPNHAETRLLLANEQWFAGELDEAIDQYKLLHTAFPDETEYMKRLAFAYMFHGPQEEAVDVFEKLLEKEPKNAEQHFYYGLLLLSLDRQKEAWPHYAWRHVYNPPHFKRFKNNYATWQGQDVAGKKMLLTWEQGIGDTIQFARYATALNEMGAEVILDIQAHLIELLSSLPHSAENPIRIHDTAQPQPEADYLISLMDIPFICTHSNIETPPIQTPYLQAPVDLIEHFAKSMAGLKGKKIGLSWQGNPNYPRDVARSIPLKDLSPLATIDGVDLVSLQCLHGTDQIKDFPHPLLDLEDDILEGNRGLSRIAAVIENVDMVICCDSAIAHLAGALNKPTWLFIPTIPDWRWKLHGNSTSLYPCMRLIRAPKNHSWEQVVSQKLPELEEFIRKL
ncbi:hypothetical protein MTBPR1_70132 [Candidatus Terasakiella magnetica]|uniref:Uncharacterized protein n=1 Tax=Candidatus Terasakiella magnetica TaxID=1867952 RepID=A0A1C3RKK9_9PROT|nr:tetratricopeptide repeat protein [Candidatus Terasakiella magnetica]SCA57860.1 hypothetical protein MTBPR1_70132 [Candidatus Terasakiella magnetica]